MHEREEKILLPKLGESILGATLVQWFKKEGDPVEVDEALCEVSTDKVNSEIPSPVKGVIKKIVAFSDDELRIGDILAIISVPIAEPLESRNSFFSPAVLRLAKEAGISTEEMESIPATGKEGRVTKEDVDNYLKMQKEKPLKKTEEKIEMTRMRKAIAENMLLSLQKIPHASLVSAIDVTKLLQKIQEEKEDFFRLHGVKLTLTSYVVHAMAQAMVRYPLFNTKLEGDMIVLKEAVNIGIAVHVEGGVRILVIRDCEKKDFPSLVKDLFQGVQKARTGKLHPDDMAPATISLSNFGMSKIPLGFPVIHYPEIAIIGLAAIEKKPIVTENDEIVIRNMVNLTLTFDHRVVDGIYSCDFLNTIKSILELD